MIRVNHQVSHLALLTTNVMVEHKQLVVNNKNRGQPGESRKVRKCARPAIGWIGEFLHRRQEGTGRDRKRETWG